MAEALSSQSSLESLFHTDGDNELVRRAERKGVPVHHVSEEIMGRLTSTVTPQGLVGVGSFLDVSLDALDRHIGCGPPRRARPGNAGTVLRSADAAGIGGVAVRIVGGRLQPEDGSRVRGLALSPPGRARRRDVRRAPRPCASRTSILAMSGEGEADLYEVELARPVAFVFGNEAWGSRRRSRRSPISACESIAPRARSLNLAAAATVALFEWSRQARGLPGRPRGGHRRGARHPLRSPR